MDAAFAGGPTYSPPTSWAAGKYLWDTPECEAPLHQILFGSAPGVQGSYSIDFGFRDQGITLRVLYVDSSEDAVFSSWVADSAAMIGPADFTCGGQTFKRCFVDAKASRNTAIQKVINSDGDVVFAMYAILKVSSKGAAA